MGCISLRDLLLLATPNATPQQKIAIGKAVYLMTRELEEAFQDGFQQGLEASMEHEQIRNNGEPLTRH